MFSRQDTSEPSSYMPSRNPIQKTSRCTKLENLCSLLTVVSNPDLQSSSPPLRIASLSIRTAMILRVSRSEVVVPGSNRGSRRLCIAHLNILAWLAIFLHLDVLVLRQLSGQQEHLSVCLLDMHGLPPLMQYWQAWVEGLCFSFFFLYTHPLKHQPSFDAFIHCGTRLPSFVERTASSQYAWTFLARSTCPDSRTFCC